jgi:hypothetical protein
MYVGVIHTSACCYIQSQRVIGATVCVLSLIIFFPAFPLLSWSFFQKRRLIRVCVSDCLWLPRLENIYLYMKRFVPRDTNAEKHITTGIPAQCRALFLREMYIR